MYNLTTGSTQEAKKFIKNNVDELGRIKSISHTRDKESISYETTIVGEYETIKVNGGLTSGFNGTGPNGLFDILVSLGVNEEDAEYYAFGNVEKSNHNFIIEF